MYLKECAICTVEYIGMSPSTSSTQIFDQESKYIKLCNEVQVFVPGPNSKNNTSKGNVFTLLHWISNETFSISIIGSCYLCHRVSTMQMMFTILVRVTSLEVFYSRST